MKRGQKMKLKPYYIAVGFEKASKELDGICYCPNKEPQIFYNGETTKTGKIKRTKLNSFTKCKLCNGIIIERRIKSKK